MFEEYKNKKVFITGHTGFKGSWLAQWMIMLGAEVYGFSLSPTDPSHYSLLNVDVKETFKDIRDYSSVEKAITDFDPDIVFHLAAQPIVLTAYRDPMFTISTNAIGTMNVLEACRTLQKLYGVVVITSDKCYLNKEWQWTYRESDELGGLDPYSASKGCAEIIARSYLESYLLSKEVMVSTTRGGNVLGGGDWGDDRLLPNMISSAFGGEELEIRNPSAVRPWQYILDVLSGYIILGSRILNGDSSVNGAWNFGPAIEGMITVSEIVDIAKGMLTSLKTTASRTGGPQEHFMLRLDSSKARGLLGWSPKMTVHETIRETVDWYKEYYSSGNVTTTNRIKRYMKDFY